LINAFDQLGEVPNKCWLFLVGEGEEHDNISKLIENKKNKQQIKLFGFRTDIPDLLKMSDVFALSSESEGLGISLLEAMSTGLIVVSTKVTGPIEVIKDSVNGFLVEKSVEGVRDGLREAISLSKEEKMLIMNNAQKTITERFVLKDCVLAALKGLNIKFIS
jgi:glycosyltransferase EpsD